MSSTVLKDLRGHQHQGRRCLKVVQSASALNHTCLEGFRSTGCFKSLVSIAHGKGDGLKSVYCLMTLGEKDLWNYSEGYIGGWQVLRWIGVEVGMVGGKWLRITESKEF